MNSKYELVSTDTQVVAGRKLYRIKALRTFRNGAVQAGDLGGYVESVRNLSETGSAWIFAPAQVMGDAKVKDDAMVAGRSIVHGHATIENFALVFDAEVHDCAVISGNASVRGRSRVFGQARISEYAQIDKMAMVYDAARVSGAARVLGSSTYIHGNARVSGEARIEAGRFRGYARVHGAARVLGHADARTVSDVMVFDGPNLNTLTAYRTVQDEIEIVHDGFGKLRQSGFKGSLDMFRNDVQLAYPCTPADKVGWFYLGLANLIEFSFAGADVQDEAYAKERLPVPKEMPPIDTSRSNRRSKVQLTLPAVIRSHGLSEIAKTYGINDALWALRHVQDSDRVARHFAVWCAREVTHLAKDERCEHAIEVAERYANGKATLTELKSAHEQAGKVAKALWGNRGPAGVTLDAATAVCACSSPDVHHGVGKASRAAAAALLLSAGSVTQNYLEEEAAMQVAMFLRMCGSTES